MATQDSVGKTREFLAEVMARYERACHAMQSGVAMKMNYDPSETSPKHLRVGINSAMVEHGALVRLLTRKGLITQTEFLEELGPAMEAEAENYRRWLSERIGTEVTLR